MHPCNEMGKYFALEYVICNMHFGTLEQLAMISMGSLSLIQEIDITQLEDFQKVHLEVFKDQLSTTIQLFGPTIGATTCTAGAVAKASGVLFTNAPGIIPDSQDPQRPIDLLSNHMVLHRGGQKCWLKLGD